MFHIGLITSRSRFWQEKSNINRGLHNDNLRRTTERFINRLSLIYKSSKAWKGMICYFSQNKLYSIRNLMNQFDIWYQKQFSIFHVIQRLYKETASFTRFIGCFSTTILIFGMYWMKYENKIYKENSAFLFRVNYCTDISIVNSMIMQNVNET